MGDSDHSAGNRVRPDRHASDALGHATGQQIQYARRDQVCAPSIERDATTVQVKAGHLARRQAERAAAKRCRPDQFNQFRTIQHNIPLRMSCGIWVGTRDRSKKKVGQD
jgi:hypothetical protein